MLTLLETWAAIGAAFGTKPEDRTAEQKSLARNGICWAVITLRKKISPRTLRVVTAAAWKELGRRNKTESSIWHNKGYMCEIGTSSGDAIRAAFCAKQVEELEKA